MTALAEGPPQPTETSNTKRNFLIKLTGIISGGMFIDGYILGGIGAVQGPLASDLELSLLWQGLVGASALIGIFIGGPLGGYLADKWGRKLLFAIDLAVFIVGSALQFVVDAGWQLFAVRLLMGIAIGADYSIGWPLLAEFAPSRLRGKLLAFQEVAWYFGYIVAYATGYALSSAIDLDWRIILGTSTIPSVILFLVRIGTPESPRWLMGKGRVEEATQLAEKYFEDSSDIADLAAEDARPASFRRLFSAEYRRVTMFVCVFYACAVTPYFAIATFAPAVLSDFGLDGLQGALWTNGLAFVGATSSFFLIERVGRRKLVIPQFWVGALALAVVGVWPQTSGLLVLVCFIFFAYANAMSTALTGVYPGEVFSTDIRGAGVGFATAVSRVGAAVGTFLLPKAIGVMGVGGTMLIAAAICVVGAIVSQLTAPETKGLPLSVTSAPQAPRVHT